jgi:ribosome biogenesis GTPase A
MSTFNWSTRQSSAASTEKKKTKDQMQLTDEFHDIPNNELSIQRNNNEKNPVYTSISNSYSTEPYTNSAKRISEQIKADKNECRSIIAQYSVDPNEFLHLLEQWTQHLIHEYKHRRERFKLLLKEKWERGELNGIKSDDDSNRRLVHVHIQKLNEWKHTGLSTIKRQLDELQPTDNVKNFTNQLIDDLLQIISSIIIIHQNVANNINNDRTKLIGSSTYLNETIEQLKRIKKINEKEYNTICIIGLEKAGKSSFINALLGFELLPFK